MSRVHYSPDGQRGGRVSCGLSGPRWQRAGAAALVTCGSCMKIARRMERASEDQWAADEAIILVNAKELVGLRRLREAAAHLTAPDAGALTSEDYANRLCRLRTALAALSPGGKP